MQQHCQRPHRFSLGLAVTATLLLALQTGTSAAATVFNEFSARNGYSDTTAAPGTAGSPNELAQAIIAAGGGVNYISDSAQFQGNMDNAGESEEGPASSPEGPFSATAGADEFHGSASFFSDLNFDPSGSTGKKFSMPSGVLLTSGVGSPPTSNTSESFSGSASLLGDAGLDGILDAAANAGLIDPSSTTDATVLAFDFTVDPDFNAVRLDFMFGTEEFPGEFFADVGAIFIDGVNYATFPDGSPLVFYPDSPAAAQLFNNDFGSAALDIEYDGISVALDMVAPLNPNLDVHSIKFGISDAADTIFDSALFVANLRGVTLDGGSGGSADDPVLPGSGDAENGYNFELDLGDLGVGLDPFNPIWIDPDVAVGYIYETTGGSPNFASLTLPSGFGDDIFGVSYFDVATGTFISLGDFLAGEIINFTTLVNILGVDKFKIDGIEAGANLDPTDPTVFPTGVSFVAGGTIGVLQTPITVNAPTAPVPGSLALMSLALFGLGAWRRRGSA